MEKGHPGWGGPFYLEDAPNVGTRYDVNKVKYEE
jgi:hypothetical protein